VQGFLYTGTRTVGEEALPPLFPLEEADVQARIINRVKAGVAPPEVAGAVVERVAIYVVHNLENARQGVGHELLGNDSVAEVPIALFVPPKDKLVVPRKDVVGDVDF
jgi:hypothetical protein